MKFAEEARHGKAHLVNPDFFVALEILCKTLCMWRFIYLFDGMEFRLENFFLISFANLNNK
jgi:hypothetical protein